MNKNCFKKMLQVVKWCFKWNFWLAALKIDFTYFSWMTNSILGDYSSLRAISHSVSYITNLVCWHSKKCFFIAFWNKAMLQQTLNLNLFYLLKYLQPWHQTTLKPKIISFISFTCIFDLLKIIVWRGW